MDKLKGLDLEGKKVLDAGTGGCNMTKYLEDWGAEVVSIDFRSDWQSDCREQTEKVQFVTGDLSNMDFIEDDSFDYVVSNFLISAVSETKDTLVSTVLREFYRVLKDKGMLVIIDYKPFHEDIYKGELHDAQTELWRMENAVAELLGEGHLEEYSAEVLSEELLSIGFRETDINILLDKVPWPIDLLKEHEDLIRDDLERLEDEGLREAFSKKLDDLMERAEKEEVRSGSIYELRAVA